MSRKKIYILTAAIILPLLIITLGYIRYASVTRIATLNFPDFTVEKLIRSNNNPFVKIEIADMAEPDKIVNYDMVLVRVHGDSMDKSHSDAIEKAIAAGVPVFSTESGNPKINSLKGRELEYIAALTENESVKNYRSLLNYIRARIDKKLLFNKSYAEPVIVPEDYYFHLGDDNFFADFGSYQAFYEKSGRYRKDAPRVALLSGNINLQNSNEEHIAAIINSLEERGMNVYPINSFGMKKLGMIEAVHPDIIICRPHGRLVMGGAESGTKLLERLNVPILAPVTVSELYDTWLSGKQGMASGGMTSMSVVMPELDGAIAPFAVAAQFDRNGMKLFDAIPGHTDKFCSLVKNFTNLQSKRNADKKIAIYYYKGTGKGAVSAADIEGVQSLYNTLKLLADNGYNVSGLPSSAGELEKMIQKQGVVLGAYALGAYDEFIKKGNPALIDVETFNQWAKESLPQKLTDDMKEQYGEAPGKYMAYEKEGKKQIAVARIIFGNIAILPQPMAAEGDEIDKITHGVEGAPAYPYVASYLWTRRGFGADALIHFGTHGSLEFIPGKQIALSDYDWSDALVGDMPHFYIYTVNNIGEGIIAKRRSYATLVSHLTAPFMQGELYGDLRRLKEIIHKMEVLEENDVKQAYRKSLTETARRLNIFPALGIDSSKVLSNADVERIHRYIEEIDGAKVTDGMYTLGKPYSNENTVNTSRLMVTDNIRYSLAGIDAAHGKITNKQLDDISFISQKYGRTGESLIRRALAGEDTKRLFQSAISESDAKLLRQSEENEVKEVMKMRGMMGKAMGNRPAKPMQPFLDRNGNIIEATEERGKKEPKNARMSMMEKMAQARPAADSRSEQTNSKEELVSSLKKLQEAISSIPKIKQQLLQSTTEEQKALLNALSGGYVLPGSAGDPIINPNAVPTGRNFYSINPETTPSPEAWSIGRRLADGLLEEELKTKGEYPQKVSFTLWSSDFISSEGATVAQILWLLGVEPLRDGFGYIRSLKLVPAEKLGRPRIDVVVQTSGQLRDIAASRLELINRAVAMAAADKSKENYVRKGFEDAERHLLEKGFSPADARRYSKERIFGGVNGNYGTGITGMVEKGDSWESADQIAARYIGNMGAMYSANGTEDWGAVKEGVFEAALLNTSVVVQPRSSNTWGPLSLDHVYEFMGGLSAAVQHVTGNDPSAYFNDFRNSSRAKVQGLKEAIGVETNSTIFNPKFIGQKLKGESGSMEYFAETVRNTFGWNAMKPSAIDQHIWNKYYDIYVNDSYNLGIEKAFGEKNPYVLQEVTAVMLESARKGMWKASGEQIRQTARLHTQMVAKHGAGGSSFVCDNAKLREYIAGNTDKEDAGKYKDAIESVRQVRLSGEQSDKSVVLTKDVQQQQVSPSNAENRNKKTKYTLVYILAALAAGITVWIIYRKKMK